MVELCSRAPGTGLAPATIASDRLTVRPLALAAQLVLRARACDAAALDAVARAIGARPSTIPNRRAGEGPYWLWLRPDAWLLVAEQGDRTRLCAALDDALRGHGAHALDVSDASAAIAIDGPAARDLLAMGIALDLAAERFAADASARTRLLDWPVTIYRYGSAGGFRLHVERGQLSALWRWLGESAQAVN